MPRRRRTAPAPASVRNSLASADAAAPGSPKRASASGCSGHVQHGPHEVLGERVEVRRRAGRTAAATAARRRRGRRRSPRASAAARRRCRRRADGRNRSRASATPGRSAPDRAPLRKADPTAIGCNAEQSSCSRPGTVSSLDAGAAADLVGRLEHRDLHALLREARPRQRARWARCRRRPQWSSPPPAESAGRPPCRGVHVTCNGIGPLGSQGCSATASVTFQLPRSMTPRAASMTL